MMDLQEATLERVARTAAACLECSPAPCMAVCPQGADVPEVMRAVRRAACARLPLAQWLLDDERVEAERVAAQIGEAYNW